jgi:ankyrin repeat protein
MKKYLLLLFISVLSSFAGTDEIQGWWVIDGDYIAKIVKDMEKSADEQDAKMLKMFMPMIEKRMSKMTMIIDDKKFSQIYGDNKRSTPYTLKNSTADTFTLQIGQREMTLKLHDDRLVNADELKGKRPPMYLRRLSTAEVAKRKEMIAAASRPPAKTAPADERLRFFIYKADSSQQDQMLKDQPDLLSLSFSHDATPAIGIAVNDGKVELFKKLLKAGADIKFLDPRERTLLFMAASSFKPSQEIIQTLIIKGLDPKALDKDEATLLTAYCDRGKDIATVDYLLSLGIDINAKSTWDKTAISEAMSNHWSEGVSHLIKKGADIQALAENMDKLARKGDIKALQFFVDNKIYQDNQGETALMHALSYSRLKNKETVIPKMIAMFKDTLNLKNKMGETALFHTKELSTIKLLIQNGADPKAVNRSQESLLHYCADAGLDVVQYYVEEQKLDVNAADNRSRTPLHKAVLPENNLDTIKYLLAKGAKPNASGKNDSSSPLSWAVLSDDKNKTAIYELLIKNGADIKDDAIMLEVAKEAIFKNDKQSLEFFRKKGANFQVNPEWHLSVFWYAIWSDKTDLLQYFLDIGIDPKVKNAAGKTALDFANEMNKPKAQAILNTK